GTSANSVGSGTRNGGRDVGKGDTARGRRWPCSGFALYFAKGAHQPFAGGNGRLLIPPEQVRKVWRRPNPLADQLLPALAAGIAVGKRARDLRKCGMQRKGSFLISVLMAVSLAQHKNVEGQ
ncbi:unnamed protein product, partial [Hapterophycus canaliculatus]